MSTVPIITALLGIVGTLLVQFLLGIRNMDVSSLNDQVSLINSVESLALKYWLAEGPENAIEAQCQAAELRGTVAATAHFRGDAERLFAADFVKYDRADGELFDLATGGDFEKSKRAADPERAIAVLSACHEIRAMLRQQRRKMYWAR